MSDTSHITWPPKTARGPLRGCWYQEPQKERGGGGNTQMFSLYSRGERLSHTFFGQINKMQSLGHIEGQSWKEHDCHMAWARVTEEFGQGLTMAQVASI